MFPIHVCCTLACGDPYVLLNILRVDKRYLALFPAPEGSEQPEGNVEIDVNQITFSPVATTAFHLACSLCENQGSNLSLIHILLKAGADINKENAEGITPFEIALGDQNNALCALLATQPELSTVPSESQIPFSLNFSYLGMNSYPDKLSFLASHLQILDLSKNPITSLPASLGLPNLTTIRLKDLNLRTFPTALFGCAKLQYVDLSNNLIALIPAHIENLVELKTLKMRNNALDALPSSLARLPKLQKLALEKNPLQSIPKEVLTHSFKTLMSYLSQMEGQTNNWKRIKLLVLGEEATGKTRYGTILKDYVQLTNGNIVC